MMECQYAKYKLVFKQPSRTSREVLTTKDVYFIRLHDTESGMTSVGECAVFPGLSIDYRDNYESKLIQTCHELEVGEDSNLSQWPSIKFGVEGALAGLKTNASEWRAGNFPITINGLVWMGNANEMIERLESKIALGFQCIKLKIGGIDFDSELKILKLIRNKLGKELEIRLDANGAFTPENALRQLEVLCQFNIHSIEQPIKQGQWQIMAELCRLSPIKIALDEELIALCDDEAKIQMLDIIKPAYIILKPTLCGGLTGSDRWIELASQRNIGWWATSALESNIGLNTIANWVSRYHPTMPQGLGTGELYTNNIPSPLRLNGERLSYDPCGVWDFQQIEWRNI